MKRTIANLTVFTLLGAASLCAETAVKADVPFDFSVGGTVMPSGQYVISSGGPSVILVRAANGKTAALSGTQLVSRYRTLSEGSLVFNKYGDRYFLSKVWVPGLGTGREVVKSKLERELAGQRKERGGLAAIRAALP